MVEADHAARVTVEMKGAAPRLSPIRRKRDQSRIQVRIIRKFTVHEDPARWVERRVPSAPGGVGPSLAAIHGQATA